MVFTKNGLLGAVAERKDAKDYVNIVDCSSWAVVNRFAVDMLDMAGMEWSPNGHYLCVWDSPSSCAVHVFNVAGELLRTFEPYDDFLGVKAVRWAPNSEILAVATYDQQVYLLEHLTWRPIWTLPHPARFAGETVV